jgi:hypothetical protein
MSDATNEHVPTPEKLEREARRLARLRRLTLVMAESTPKEGERRVLLRYDADDDPKEAA